MTFERPLALVLLGLLGLLPVVGYLAWSSRARLGGGRRTASTIVRLAGLAILVLATAGVGAGGGQRETTVFVLDVSDSVLLAQRSINRDWVEEAIGAGPADGRVAVVEFSDSARITQLPVEIRDIRGGITISARSGGAGRGALGKAISQAVSLIGEDGVGKIVLLTDGEMLGAGVDRALAKAVDRGITVSVVSPLELGGADLALEPPRAPRYVYVGKSFDVQVAVVAQREADVRLRLWAGERLAADTQVQVGPGVNLLGTKVTPEEEGVLVLRAEILDNADALTENNVAESLVRVLAPARILLVGDPLETGALAATLATEGFEVVEVGAEGLPRNTESLSEFGAVILTDVPARALDDQQMGALLEFVRERGHGLVVTGGANAFGPGEYQGTALEGLLPVRSNPPEEEIRGLALVLVVDRSVSMSFRGTDMDVNKFSMAKEAAVQAVHLLEAGDQVGVVGFDAEARWIVEPTRIETATDKMLVEAKIRAMELGNSTDIYTAVQMARKRMTTLEARLKHMILITDGQARFGNFKVFGAQVRHDEISVSTVAVGEDADTELLKELARDGNGRYYQTDDPAAIPALLTKETEIAHSFFMVDRRQQPRVAQPSPVFAEVTADEPIPYLGSFVRTRLRPEATAVLVSDSNDPILATWQAGFGRVAVWTSNVGGEWSEEWRAWSAFGGFVSGLTGWVIAGAQDRNEGIRVSSRVDGWEVAVVVESVDDAGRFRNNMETAAVLRSPDGETVAVTFEQTGPGRYEVVLPKPGPGAYRLTIEQRTAEGERVGPVLDGFVVGYSAEFRQGRPGTALLNWIAARTGGETLATPEEVLGGTNLGSGQRLAPLLLTVGMLLFMADIAVRRLRMGRAELREQYLDVLEWVDHHHPGRVATMVSRRLRQGLPGSN